MGRRIVRHSRSASRIHRGHNRDGKANLYDGDRANWQQELRNGNPYSDVQACLPVLRAVNTGTPCVGVYANHGPGAKPTGPFSNQTLARDGLASRSTRSSETSVPKSHYWSRPRPYWPLRVGGCVSGEFYSAQNPADLSRIFILSPEALKERSLTTRSFVRPRNRHRDPAGSGRGRDCDRTPRRGGPARRVARSGSGGVG
jgi:hypothetical protein